MPIADLIIVVAILGTLAVIGWFTGPQVWKPKSKRATISKWPRG